MNTGGGHNESLYRLVITHYLASAFCFVILAAMLLASGEVFAGHYFQPKLLAITHMAALGWGSLIIFGACYQLLPVVLQTELYSYKIAWLSFVLFVPGLCLLVHSFWIFDPGVYMQTGALLLLTAILLFTINAYLTSQKEKKKETIHEELIVTSCFWLTGTAVLGALLVFNFRFAFLPKDHLHFLRLHVHMGVVGWFLLLVIGVSSKLIPMFVVSREQRTKLLHWGYNLINFALLAFLVDTYFAGLNYRTVIIAFIGIAGVITYLIFIYYCFRSRVKRAIDLPVKSAILSAVLLSSAIVVLPFLLFYHLKADPFATRLTMLYGTLLFMGWISALILGKTFKTLPFIIWVKHYENDAGKTKTPMPADLYRKWLLKLQSLAFLAFCILFFGGILLNLPGALLAGLVCLLVTALCYLANVLVLVLHRNKHIQL